MKPTIIVVGIAVGVLVAHLGDVQAQMFGSQSKRGMSNAKLGTGGSSTGEMAGASLQGNERFVRGNRRASDFVGADVRDRKSFVGALPTGTTLSQLPAVGRILRARAPAVGPATGPGAHSATAVCQPRLAVGFEVPQVAPDVFTATVARQLAATPGLHPANQIEVSVADGTATLRGVVASERDRSLIERLLLFEPGISAVQNDLKVMPPQERSGRGPSPSPLPPAKSASSSPPK